MTAHQRPLSTQLSYVAGVTALVLMLPLLAMQFTHEVVWTLSDFIIAGILLMAAGTAYVVGTRLVKTKGQRLLVGALVGFTLVLVWAELAVGIFGTPFAGS
jgi:hypothetical protein